MKIRCYLRPKDGKTSKFLLQKSSNNINPYVLVDTLACTRVTTLLAHIGTIFREEAPKFVLRVFKSKFSLRKCQQGDLRMQDLLSAEDPDKLEAALQSEDENIELTVRYEIRKGSGSRDSAEVDPQSSSAEEEVEIP
mmetsp:Transcript_39932/g.52245  ORF Transcript_39932/g.52245 Transcript_39932/m.52245 type:complete len:137 (+) Transcript_39932:26-436(+)